MTEVDLNKVVRQHLEMEGFFTGFAVRGKTAEGTGSLPTVEPRSADLSPAAQPVAVNPASAIRDSQSVADAGKELAAVAGEVGAVPQVPVGVDTEALRPGRGPSAGPDHVRGRGPGGR